MVVATANFIRAVKFRQTCPWCVLSGTSGAGKSHLAKRVYRWWKETGMFYAPANGRGATLVRPGQWVSWPDFILECRQGDSSRMEDMFDDQLLVLDDIGAGTDSRGWMTDKLHHVLERRLEDSTKATFITINLSLVQVAETYGQRVASRMIRRGKERFIEVDLPDFKCI